IENIDIGGISLIRAEAKNFTYEMIDPSQAQNPALLEVLNNGGETDLAQRNYFAACAFNVSSHYDSAIFNYFNRTASLPSFKLSLTDGKKLRYGENPHQEGVFYGDLDAFFDILNGKELSYNNILDIDAAVRLIDDFQETTFAILKHNNACGIATRKTLPEAWKDALSGDPVSAFGGVLICNRKLDKITAEEISKLFFEVIIAPEYDEDSLAILKTKKNRIILKRKDGVTEKRMCRTALNGLLVQKADTFVETTEQLKTITDTTPTKENIDDLLFAAILVKHTKSNAIVLAKNRQLLASGTGQTSRVDALRQAIAKAEAFGFDLKDAVMASDAFFPFPDCVEIAHQAGITAVVQPGGSVNDKTSIEYCNQHGIAMVMTGIRHFKH
ncbi:MAG: bifunctional phosphoribosylaminoimidazolecarboxamide formyltransferase/IMP cyclohydrolase, partial [Bacteroidota bacterium]